MVMGLIKTILGGIFGLLGGIAKAFLGVLGIGKTSEFYMELDESATSVASTPAPAAPAPKAEASPAPAPAAPAPKMEASPASAAPAPKAEPSPAPAPAAATPVAAPAPTAPVVPAPPLPSFAANYLGTTSGALKRRRPGPSLSNFRDMAQQVKTPVA